MSDITYDCWDFAGQELYYVTHQFVWRTTFPRLIKLVHFKEGAVRRHV